MASRILVVDDHALTRGGVIMLLSAAADLQIVGEAATGREALAVLPRLRPDVIVMDLRMPDLDGAAATRALIESDGERDWSPRVLILSTFHDDEAVYDALRAGANGFVTKDSAPAQLVSAVRTVAEGGSWLDPAVAGQVIEAVRATPYRGRQASSALVARLTPREQEVLGLLAEGRSTGDICEALVLSEATVRTHVARVLMKTGSRDRAQAVSLAYQSGLVAVPRS